jgi:DNA-binding GntR family transcriptional regulator
VTPVREALRRLEAEGIVTYDPHIGASVVQVDFGPTEENFRIRAALESLAATMAASRMAPEDLRGGGDGSTSTRRGGLYA